MRVYVVLRARAINQVKLIFSMDTDTNVYIFVNRKYGVFVCLLLFNINLYWCNLLIHVVNIIIVRSV